MNHSNPNLISNPLDPDPDDYMLRLEKSREKLAKRLRQVEAALQASQNRNGILAQALLQKTKQASITSTTSIPIAKNEPTDWVLGAGLVEGYWEGVKIDLQKQRNEQIDKEYQEQSRLKSAKDKNKPSWVQNQDDLLGDRGGDPNHLAFYNGW